MYRFRDKRRFQSKITNFSHPVYFTPRWWGFPWNCMDGYRRKVSKS